MVWTYICSTYCGLDHVVSPVSHVAYKVEDVYDALSLHLLQHVVYGDKCSSASHAGTRNDNIQEYKRQTMFG